MKITPSIYMCLKQNRSPLPQVIDQCNEYGELLKIRKKGRDRSIDWFSNKFDLPFTPKQLEIPEEANIQNGRVVFD